MNELIEYATKFDSECVIRDHFEVDKAFETRLSFPCCVCINRHGSDRDEPCIRCSNNLNSLAE